MKFLVLVGLFSAAAIPMASASESTEACQVDDTRRVAEAPEAPEAPTVPIPPAGRPNVAQRDAEPQVRQDAVRRRSGKRIPDAELIGPRRAL